MKESLEMSNMEPKKNDEEQQNHLPPKSRFGQRHIQVLLNFLLVFIAYGIRVNMSVGIVAMTDPKASVNPNIPTFPDWHDKSIVLSSFFWGYVIPQIGAGILAMKYGPKWFLVTSMTFCSFFGLILPTMAIHFGSHGVMISRAIQGFCQGFFFPSIHTMLGKWVPASERSRMGSFVYAGGSLGTVVSLIVSGIISESWAGWPMIFYVYGMLGLAWAFLMAFLGSNSPAEHPKISQEERYLIESSLGQGEGKKEVPTPWIKMITSLPVWAVLITHCGQNWGFWTLMTEIPLYMGHVMHFDIKSNSYVSALPYFILWLLSFVFSALADTFIVRGITSIGTTRKIFNSIGLIIPCLALILLGTVENHITVSIILVNIAVSVNSAIYSGFNVNHIDLAPNHSGTLMGVTNCISNIFSLLAPLAVQVIVQDENDQSEWKIVFFLSAAIYLAANTFFVLFGSGEIQPWNDPEQDDLKKEPKQA